MGRNVTSGKAPTEVRIDAAVFIFMHLAKLAEEMMAESDVIVSRPSNSASRSAREEFTTFEGTVWACELLAARERRDACEVQVTGRDKPPRQAITKKKTKKTKKISLCETPVGQNVRFLTQHLSSCAKRNLIRRLHRSSELQTVEPWTMELSIALGYGSPSGLKIFPRGSRG